MNQTKGYLTLEGNIKFLGAKSLKDYDRNKKLIFAIETKPENIIGIEAFGWKKEDTDDVYVSLPDKTTKKIQYADREWLEEGETIQGTSVKKDKADKAVTLVDIDAVEFIAANFKNGDSVFVNMKSEIDAYRGSLKYTISKIYPCSKVIDFNSPDFTEENHGVQWVIFDSIEGSIMNTYIIGKKDGVLPIKFELSPDLSPADFAQFNAGDALYLDYELVKTAVYKEVEEQAKPEQTGFKSIGKYAGAQTSGGSKFKTIDKYIEKFICVGVKDAKVAEVDMSLIKTSEEDGESLPF